VSHQGLGALAPFLQLWLPGSTTAARLLRILCCLLVRSRCIEQGNGGIVIAVVPGLT